MIMSIHPSRALWLQVVATVADTILIEYDNVAQAPFQSTEIGLTKLISRHRGHLLHRLLQR